MLQSLLSADGVNPAMITVFIDGYFEVYYQNSHFAFHFHISHLVMNLIYNNLLRTVALISTLFAHLLFSLELMTCECAFQTERQL